MNKKLLFVIPLLAIYAGCASVSAPGSPGPVTCVAYDEAPCDGDKMHPIVEIDLDTQTITPECIKAKRGRVVIFELVSTSPISKGTVEIIPKYGTNGWWLGGSNTPNKKRILVLAPKKQETGPTPFPTGDYKFKVKTPTWCKDPRIRVEP